MILSIPIAWLQLIHQRVRFVATLVGLSFVVTLLFMQLGFQEALFSSAVRVHQSLQADLFMVSLQYKSLTSQQSFPRSRLYQTLAFDEVDSVSPLYFQFGKLKNIETAQKFSIFVFGLDPGKPAFNLSEINQNLDKLKLGRAALFDRASRPEFGPVTEKFGEGKPVSLEIAPFNDITVANRYDIRGLFTIGPSFGVDGNLITNHSTFLNTFHERLAENIDIGLITLKPGSNAQEVQQKLLGYLPKDVQVLNLQEYIALEKEFWNQRTPVGFTFRLMVTMGFIVGVGVAYQILYTNIASHLVEFATLKAMGFAGGYLLNTVFQQALLLAILGFIPGLIASFGIYDLARKATHLPVIMTRDQILVVLASIVSMCSISGFLAIQKLRAADPADIF